MVQWSTFPKLPGIDNYYYFPIINVYIYIHMFLLLFTRNTWTRLVGMQGSDGSKWSALLGVAHAAKLDAGLFTCQVSYRGRQQCRTIRLHVLAPEVRLAPMSVTAYKVKLSNIQTLSIRMAR